MIRDLKLEDFVHVEDLHNGEYPLPNINSPLVFVQKVIQDESGNIVGSFFVNLTSEVSLVLDESISGIRRAKYIKEIFEYLIKQLSEKGLNDTHVFILPETDDKYAQFLEKHFHFKKCTGIPMYYRKDFSNVESAKPRR